jgi:hypothetical protein
MLDKLERLINGRAKEYDDKNYFFYILVGVILLGIYLIFFN